MTYKQVFTGLSLLVIGASRLLIAQEISITNANWLVEVCILNPEVIPEKHRALVDSERDIVLRISLYHRSYEPRNDKEEWQPHRAGRGGDLNLIDQYPSPKRKLVPSKRVELEDHQFLAIFQKDRSFFGDSQEVILHLKGTYEFLFHYSPSNLFGEMPPREACRRESNANNRIDVVLVNSATHTEKGLGESIDLDRNVGFRISSYKRSYMPRNDKEGWRPASEIPRVRLVDRHPEPSLSQEPIREVAVSDHEVLVAFPRDFLPEFLLLPWKELVLNVGNQYLLHYSLEDLGIRVGDRRSAQKENLLSGLLGKPVSELVEVLGEPDQANPNSAMWQFFDYSVNVDLDTGRSRVISVVPQGKESTFEKVFSELVGSEGFQSDGMFVDQDNVYWRGHIGHQSSQLTWNSDKPAMVIERMTDDPPDLAFSFEEDLMQAELSAGEKRVVVTWLPTRPLFLKSYMGKEWEGSIVFRVDLHNCGLSEPNMSVQDQAIQPNQVIGAQGIVLVRDQETTRPTVKSRGTAAERYFFAVFLPDPLFYSHREGFFLHISDQRKGWGGEEYFLRFGTIPGAK